MIFEGLISMIEANKNLTHDQAAFIELASLSISLWDRKQFPQAWLQNILNYYQSKKGQLTIELLKKDTKLHYFASQLCIFFAAVQITGLYQTLYRWIEDILSPESYQKGKPVYILPLSDQHRLEIVRAVIGYEQANAGAPEFGALVQKLKALYPTSK